MAWLGVGYMYDVGSFAIPRGFHKRSNFRRENPDLLPKLFGISLVTGPSKRGNKNPKDFLDRGPGETEFKLVGNPL